MSKTTENAGCYLWPVRALAWYAGVVSGYLTNVDSIFGTLSVKFLLFMLLIATISFLLIVLPSHLVLELISGFRRKLNNLTREAIVSILFVVFCALWFFTPTAGNFSMADRSGEIIKNGHLTNHGFVVALRSFRACLTTSIAYFVFVLVAIEVSKRLEKING